ncbi:MAG: tetratricopeptide repeat protein [Candidatus Tectimicrobiota bacterium]
MYDEKFELLEAKIRETTMLVSRLREEKRQLEWENEQLRARVAELEAQLAQSGDAEARYVPNLDHLLEQLDTLQQEEASDRAPASASPASTPLVRESPPPEDHVQRGIVLEQQGQYEQALYAYQRALELDGDNLDAAQRLAFLLEKLNRDAEAAALWDKIWAMRDAQPSTRRRRLR